MNFKKTKADSVASGSAYLANNCASFANLRSFPDWQALTHEVTRTLGVPQPAGLNQP